jgi:hypothetical protein
MYASAGLTVPFINSGVKASSPLWTNQMRTQYTNLDPSRFVIRGGWNFDYMDEYFGPWLQGQDDEFTSSRFGHRATVINKMVDDAIAKGQVTPEARAEVARQFTALGTKTRTGFRLPHVIFRGPPDPVSSVNAGS